MSTSDKGTRMERLAMEELRAEIVGKTILREWRCIRHQYQNTDFLGLWDFCFLTSNGRPNGKILYLVQVKSRYSSNLMLQLYNGLPDFQHGYLAVYGTEPKKYNFMTKNFFWIRV